MPTDPITRSLRIEAIRRQIAIGKYSVSADAIAAALLVHMRQRLSVAA